METKFVLENIIENSKYQGIIFKIVCCCLIRFRFEIVFTVEALNSGVPTYGFELLYLSYNQKSYMNTSFVCQLDKISTLSRGKDKKDKCRADAVFTRVRSMEELARDEQQILSFQQTISRLTDFEINARFEQMLVSIITRRNMGVSAAFF